MRANADCQLITVVAHAQLTNVGMGRWDGEFVAVAEFFNVIDAAEFLGEAIAEAPCERAQSFELFLGQHRNRLRSNGY